MWQLKRYADRYAVAGSPATQSCVLMPGWSVNGDIFEWLLPALAQNFIIDVADVTDIHTTASFDDFCDAFYQQLLANTSGQVWLFAWSLAGNVAINIAARYPDKVAGLCVLASNPCFVEKQDWPHGMSEPEFARFYQAVSRKPLQSLHKFDALQAAGDAEEADLKKSLKDYRALQIVQKENWSAASLVKGLDFLASVDSRVALANIRCPCILLYGQNDQLVNMSAAPAVKVINPLVHIQTIANAGHLLFLSQTDAVFQAFMQLVNKTARMREKQKVAQSFSRAAVSYDGAAFLQQQVAADLLEWVEPFHRGLDAGCGTGFWTKKLQAFGDEVVGLDMAEGMLQFANAQHSAAKINFVAGDIEQAPLANNSVDLIFSSLAVQWCENLHQVLQHWYQLLKPGGQVLIATLGENTLHELRNSFQTVDNLTHVNQFLSHHDILSQVGGSDFVLQQQRVETKVVGFENLQQLMRDLKNIGAQQVLHGGAKGLMGKSRFKQLLAAYEPYRGKNTAKDLLPASYDVVYLQLRKSV